MNTLPNRADNRLKRVVVAVWVIGAVSLVAYWFYSGLTPRAFAVDIARRVSDLIAGRWYGPLLYTLAYFLRPLTLFSSTVLTVVAGNIYGLWWGYFWALLAGTLSAALPYAAGRWLVWNPETAADDMPQNRLRRYVHSLRAHPFEAVITMRLLRLPYDAVSFFAGGIGVTPRTFFLATLIGNLVGTLPYVLLGASVKGNPLSADVQFRPWIFALGLVLLVLSIGASQLIRRANASRSQ